MHLPMTTSHCEAADQRNPGKRLSFKPLKDVCNITKGDTTLQKSMKEMLDKMTVSQQKLLIDNLNAKTRLEVGSLCSGTELQAFVGSELFKLLRQSGHVDDSIVYDTQFACEIDRRKQRWIVDYVHPRLGMKGCVFSDIRVMGKSSSTCIVHSKMCHVPQRLDIVICGWSCKDLSSCSSKQSAMKSCMPDGEGSTGQTFRGLIAFMTTNRCKVLIGENVDDIMGTSESKNFDCMVQAFAAAGYVCGATTVKASEHGSVQRRNRMYVA